MGVEIRERWTVGGYLPGEPEVPVELGIGAPKTGLYIREDVDLRANIIMISYVKKTMKDAHGKLVEKIKNKTGSDLGTMHIDDDDESANNNSSSNNHFNNNPSVTVQNPPGGVEFSGNAPPYNEVEGSGYHPPPEMQGNGMYAPQGGQYYQPHPTEVQGNLYHPSSNSNHQQNNGGQRAGQTELE